MTVSASLLLRQSQHGGRGPKNVGTSHPAHCVGAPGLLHALCEGRHGIHKLLWSCGKHEAFLSEHLAGQISEPIHPHLKAWIPVRSMQCCTEPKIQHASATGAPSKNSDALKHESRMSKANRSTRLSGEGPAHDPRHCTSFSYALQPGPEAQTWAEFFVAMMR